MAGLAVIFAVPVLFVIVTIFSAWDEAPPKADENGPHLFWIRDGRLSRLRRFDDTPIHIAPRTVFGIRQPFTHAPKRFMACFKQTELFGESTYRNPLLIERVRLEDAQALIEFLHQLRLIESLYGSSDGCFLAQMDFLRKEPGRRELPFTIDLD